MSLRAIILGILGAVAICGTTYFNDAVMQQTFLVGNNMPIAVYGMLILIVIVVNPLLLRFARQSAFSGRELAVMLSLTLAACCIPGSGFMRTFTTSLVIPYHIQKTTPAWQEGGALERVPSYMLASVTHENENDVVSGFVQGKGTLRRHISLTDIPWRAWIRPLAFWLPLVLLLWFALLGLGLVVHRQWSEHEHLPYPIATFANALLPGPGRAVAEVLGNRLFQVAAAAVLCVHLNNFACNWVPNALVQIPLRLELWPLARLFPTFTDGGGWFAFQPQVYFTVVAMAYFLAADVSLALGIGPYLWAWIAGGFAAYGIVLRGPTPNLAENLACGAYLGLLGVILYTGRRYYVQVLRATLGLRGTERPDASAILGGRLFLGCILLFIAYLSVLGRLDWQLATVYAFLCVVIFLGMGRILAETGLFFNLPTFFPLAVMLGLFGTTALGPESVLIISLVSVVLLADPREAFLPFLVNSLKLADLQHVATGRIARATGAVLVLGLGVALTVTLYFQYDRGANMADAWATYHVPSVPFNEVVRTTQRLAAQDLLLQSESLHGWARFTHMTPVLRCVLALLTGLAAFVLLTIGRLRFSWWPVHPVLLLFWFSYPGSCFAFSFLLGWLIKVLVTHFGGGNVYRTLKPLMFGLIAGEMVAGLITIAIGWAYYFITGHPPPAYAIMPI